MKSMLLVREATLCDGDGACMRHRQCLFSAVVLSGGAKARLAWAAARALTANAPLVLLQIECLIVVLVGISSQACSLQTLSRLHK